MSYDNPVMENLLTRASVRRFSEQPIEKGIIEKIVAAGQQAPFTGQMYSVVVTQDAELKEKMSSFFGPLPKNGDTFMLICVDFDRLEKFIAAKGRSNSFDDYWMMILGIQDAAYLGQNIITAAESYGIGSVFLGQAPWLSSELSEIFALPQRVWPLVGLVLGYKAEDPAPRPRIPLQTVLHWDRYQGLDEQGVQDALQVMDAGLIREGYYSSRNAKIPLRGNQEDQVSFPEYGWSEHISRKYSQGGHNMSEQGRDIAAILRKQGLKI